MVARSATSGAAQEMAQGKAPTIPRLSRLASPSVHPSADVHEFSFLQGAVSLGPSSMVAPGTAISAGSGASIVVGEACSLLPGVLVEGVSGPQVMGLAQQHCSVWVGNRVTIAHKSIVHSPAFIGEGCFIGFRSTIFNARLGDGCVVMMHALVQDVEIPPGKCVPSGSVITSQHQADQLPNVRPEDLVFVREVLGSETLNRSSRRSSSNGASPQMQQPRGRFVPVQRSSNSHPYSTPVRSTQRSAGQAGSRSHSNSSYSSNPSYVKEGANMQAQRLSPEIVQQVRQYLSQGYRVGMEHADVRRYRSGVWETCTPIKDTREQAVFEALERCLAEHAGEYVRMFGIDTQVKRRVGMVTVQRPDGRPVNLENKAATTSASRSSGGYGSTGYAPSSSNGNGSAAGGGLTPELVQEVRNLLRGGYIIGTEHADARRYRSNVWKSCSPIRSVNEQEVLSRLDHCLAEHSGEYVRMFGIDPQAKRRLATITIQRADGKPVAVSPSRPVANASSVSQNGGSYSQSGAGGDGTTAQVVNQIVAQGNQIGVEFADARRYRSGIWQTAPSAQSLSQLQAFLAQNADKYVRVFGVNKSTKTRGSATTIQKPGQAVDVSSTTSGGTGAREPMTANSSRYDSSSFAKGGNNGGSNGAGPVDSDVMNQVTQLVNQGCRIAIEFADKRRFRSGIWQTGPAIDARRPADAISALGQQLAQHQGDYVRLVGVDPQAKRRVLETTIQRP